jgi:hypothetical protein
VIRFYLAYQGDSVELPLGETVVGRDPGCALRFNDAAVSRQHVRIVRRQEEVFVEDLGSTNGTLVNGTAAASPTAIHSGDVLTIGTRELTILAITTSSPEPPTIDLDMLSAPNENRAQWLATARMQTVEPLEHAMQRCPRCGAQVSAEDDACASCKFRWGGFRTRTPTVPTATALSRRTARQPIELHVMYVSNELEVEAMTKDLSLGGVFICSQVLDAVGTPCKLTILADGRAPLDVHGVVRRVDERGAGGAVGMGVEFIRLTVADRAWLDVVIQRIAADATLRDAEPLP